MTKKTALQDLCRACALLLIATPLVGQAAVKIKGAVADERLVGVWVLDSARSDLVSSKIDSAFNRVLVMTRTTGTVVVRRGDPLPRLSEPGPPPIALFDAERASRQVLLAEIRATELRIAFYPEGVSLGVSPSQSISWITDKKDHAIPVGEHELSARSSWKDGVLENKLVTPTGNEWKRTLKLLADGTTLEVVTQVTVDGQKFKYTRRFVRGAP